MLMPRQAQLGNPLRLLLWWGQRQGAWRRRRQHTHKHTHTYMHTGRLLDELLRLLEGGIGLDEDSQTSVSVKFLNTGSSEYICYVKAQAQ